MNLRTSFFSIFLTLLLCSVSFAESIFTNEEKEQLFKELTSKPKAAWIQAGSIEATREEYRAPKTTDEKEILSQISKNIEDYQNNDNKAEKAEYLQKMALDAIPFNTRYYLSNEYTMKTTTVLKYDGKRYYCDIKVDSRKDSVLIQDTLKSNYKTNEFNMTWNSRRILCYDGEKYIMYTPSVSHAIIESTENMPNTSISLLNNGLIPWGYGSYTYDKLIKFTSSVEEKTVDGHSEVHITLIDKDGSEFSFVLDPEKEYAPLSWVVNTTDSTFVHVYSGYKLVSDSWVPTSVVIEKFDNKTNKLLEGDYTTITKINGEIPSAGSFVVDFIPNTLIEYSYDITKPELQYFYSDIANSDLLLAEKKAYMATEGKQLQNCATASLQYAALQLGKDILNPQLSEIVNSNDFTSSLKDIKKYAENQGFNCKAVTTDIQTLKELSDCQAILHLPSKNHFVLLDHIDQKYAWIIDLTEDKFYYRIDINFFNMEWTEGTALLISNKSISLPSGAVEIPDDKLTGYTGGSGYTCTYLLQSHRIIYCIYDGANCFGLYQIYFPRYGCEYAESGACAEEYKVLEITWPCYNHPLIPYSCTINTDLQQFYYILACK